MIILGQDRLFQLNRVGSVMVVAGVHVIGMINMLMRLIMPDYGHPDLVGAATTGAAHLGHLHTQQGELATSCHFHIGAAAIAQQQQVVPPDIVATRPAVQPASRLVDEEFSTLERCAVGGQLEGEQQRVSQDSGKLPHLQAHGTYRPITGLTLDSLNDALGDRQLVHLGPPESP
jgi:hypothetical protein